MSAIIIGAASTICLTFGKAFLSSYEQNSAQETIIFWVILGGSGVFGGFASHMIHDFGLRNTYILGVIVMSVSIALLTINPTLMQVNYLSALLFGSSYILITGAYMVWGTDLFRSLPAIGIGLPFIILSIGQGAGVALAGLFIDLYGFKVSFMVFCLMGLTAVIALPHKEAKKIQSTA